MCGFAGFWDHGRRDVDASAAIRGMTDAIHHRGPDDRGEWHDPRAALTLGHRRLSILDLSAEGHQPMASPSGRWMLVFNGEIYNFSDLRRELEALGHQFRGHSDTEVMLAAFESWGVGATSRFAGMFAYALWDRNDRVLHLCRDRLGEKPLYYGWAGETLLFGSELKALRRHPHWQGAIDRDALTLFFRHGYVPSPWSIYKGIRKVMPGTVLSFAADRTHGAPTESTYWSARGAAMNGVADALPFEPDNLANELDGVLRRAVKREMVADVELGAFLSGGIDSSLIVSLMQAQSDRPVRTFTIGFHERGFDEAIYAKAVASHLGTQHTELYVTPDEARSVIPELPRIYDEPFADSSQIPTYLVAKLARLSVTVCLSGDGGDELFGGYSRYVRADRIAARIERVPRPARGGLAAALRLLTANQWDGLMAVARPLAPASLRQRLQGVNIHRAADALALGSSDQLYRAMVSHSHDPAGLVLGGHEAETVFSPGALDVAMDNRLHRMMLLDLLTYLPDDILVKVDRAAMAASLETRAPFLDHEVVEFAWRLPLEAKVRGGQGKWLVRKVLERYVPRALIERPKMGFGVPIGTWLRGPLREWASALLEPRQMAQEGLLDSRLVATAWEGHLSRRVDAEYLLWDVLMFQAWHQAEREGSLANLSIAC